MPDPIETPAAPDVEIDMGALTSAIANTPLPGMPTPPTAPVEAPPPEAAPVEAKPDEAKPADAKPKKGLDALPEEKVEAKKEDKPKAEEKAEPEVDTTKWPKQQGEAFAAMRSAKKRAEEQAKDAQVRYEKLQKEYEQFKSNPKDRPETLEKLQRLEAWEKAQELKTTPEWQDAVVKPIQKSLDMLNRIAGRAKVDADALIKATDEEIDFERIDAITKVFESAEEPVPAHLISAAIEEAKKLHPLYGKAAEMERNSKETLASLSHQTAQQKEAAAQKEAAEYEKHHTHIYDQMAKKLPSLFGDADLAAEVKAARPGTDPADRAYEAQAGTLLPKLVEKYFALRADFEREKAAKLALLGTRAGVTPPTTPAGTKPINGDDTELDEEGLAAVLPRRR